MGISGQAVGDTGIKVAVAVPDPSFNMSSLEHHRFYEEFLQYLELSPSKTKDISAVATIAYSLDLHGEHLEETAVYQTDPSPVEEPTEEWWTRQIWYPVVRFASRFWDGDIIRINYR